MTAPRVSGRKQPGDRAAGELERLAEALREDAARPPGQRRLLGVTAPRWLTLAADVLADVARGQDGRKRIDWRRKAMPRERAIAAVLDAAPEAANLTGAIALAAERLGLCDRTVERHWTADQRERGCTYLLTFAGSTTPTPRGSRRRT